MPAARNHEQEEKTMPAPRAPAIGRRAALGGLLGLEALAPGRGRAAGFPGGTCGRSSASPRRRAMDLVARLLAESLRPVSGQTVVVDLAQPHGFG